MFLLSKIMNAVMESTGLLKFLTFISITKNGKIKISNSTYFKIKDFLRNFPATKQKTKFRLPISIRQVFIGSKNGRCG